MFSMLLPMTLVRNQIRNMLSGERGKSTFGTIKYEFRTSSKKYSKLVQYLVHWKGADCKVFVKFINV
jgi:hypothetical protein